jgi:site-specific recombinase XerC
MELNYSKDALMKFYGYLSSKGLVNQNTVAARKAAANKMLSILDETESADLRSIDIDQVATRFFNLHGKDFTPDSMTTYKSRLKSGIDDFIKYTTNPASFKPEGSRPRAQRKLDNEVKSQNGHDGVPHVTPPRPDFTDESVFPIPIRQGLVVKLIGLPSDLSKKEAQKIANVVLAFANIED